MSTTSSLRRRVASALTRPMHWFDRWWWTLAVAAVPLVAFLNYDAQAMRGIMPEYECFRDVVVAGMDPAANHCRSPTFPMWGYGWVLAITESKWVILVTQGLFALLAVWFFVRVLEQEGVLTRAASRLVKVLVVLSIPWYAFNTVLWPYSFAVSFTLLSVTMLLLALRRPSGAYAWILASGVLLGLGLNFRSDNINLVLIIAAAVICLVRPRRLQAKRMAVWLAAVVLALVPWTIYSYRATDHVILTSTNSGHVLYISLGQLPDNPWHITPLDTDPRMARELGERFSAPPPSSMTYSSDVFLRGRFIELIRQHPIAWLHKNASNLRGTLTGAVYPGEFSYPQIIYLLEGKLVALIGFLLAPVFLFLGVRRRSIGLTLVALLPAYQLLMNTFTFNLNYYSSNAYVPMLVLIALASEWTISRATTVARSLRSSYLDR